MIRRVLISLAAVTLALTGAAAAAGPASATYGPGHEYQVTLSVNCNNPTLCAGNMGGDWGWAVFNADGTGDLQATFCFHILGMGGGAGHSSVDIYAWHIAGGMFVIDSASDPSFEGPSPIPSIPGHYNDHPAPGINAEITVVAVPSH